MLLYLDNLGAVPTSTSTIVPSNIKSWAYPAEFFYGATVTIDTRFKNSILSGSAPISAERYILFSARNVSGNYSPSRGQLSLSVKSKTPLATHYLGGMFLMETPESGADLSLARTIIGWNSGLDYSNITSDPTETQWENTGVLIIDGKLSVGGALGSTVLADDTPYFIEVMLDPTLGKVSAWIDGAAELTDVPITGLTSVDEMGWMMAVRPSRASGELGHSFCVYDFYFLDDTGNSFNSRLGPIKVQRLPLDDEDDTTWTPEGGAASNIAAVNKTTLSDATYNRSPGTNDKSDTFTVDTSGIDPNATILGVVTCSFAAKSDIGDRGLDGIATKNGQTVREGFGDHFSSVYQGSNQLVMHEAPDGTAWDISAIDNTVFGYEVKA